MLRTFGTALALAAFVATAMVASGARVEAAGPGGGNSQQAICRNLERAIAAATALYGADSELVLALQAQYTALGCAAAQ